MSKAKTKAKANAPAKGKTKRRAGERPKGVPETARWNDGYWSDGSVDDEGRKHGPYRHFTAEGVFYCRDHFEHGLRHGESEHVHPDGTTAERCHYHHGLPSDLRIWRAEVPSSITFPPTLVPSIWHAHYVCPDGLTYRAVHFFLRDGTEVAMNGAALPPRPHSVPATAQYVSTHRQWLDGSYSRATWDRVGVWHAWSTDGVLVQRDEHGDDGGLRLVVSYDAESRVCYRRTHDAEGRRREEETFDTAGTRNGVTRWDENDQETYEARWTSAGALRKSHESRFEGDRLVARTQRLEGGKLALVVELTEGGNALSCALFDDEERPEACGLVRDGHFRGPWELFSEGGVRSVVDLEESEVEVTFEHAALRRELRRALYLSWRAANPAPPARARGKAKPNAGPDSVNWKKIAGAFAENLGEFPDYLRALAAPEPLVRGHALAAIADEIEHQGSVYPATAKVIPFLIRALEHPNTDGAGVLALLEEVGDAAAAGRDEVTELPADDENRISIEGTLSALAAAWPALRARFAASSDGALRRQFLHFARFAVPPDDALADVMRLGESEDPGVRAGIAAASIELGAPTSRLAACFDDGDPLVRAVAAITGALHWHIEVPAELLPGVEAALAAAIAEIPELTPRYAATELGPAPLASMLAAAVASLRPSPALRDLAPTLCAHLATADVRSAADVFARSLLQLVLGKNAEPPFSPHVATVLAAIAESAPVWFFNVHAGENLSDYRLPPRRADLRALVVDLKKAADPSSVLLEQLEGRRPLLEVGTEILSSASTKPALRLQF